MKYNKFSKTSFKLIIIYAVLMSLACIFLLTTIDTNAFAYLYLIALTMPWSALLAVIAFFYEGIGDMSSFYKIGLFGVFALLNTIIINWLGLNYDKKKIKAADRVEERNPTKK